MARYSNPNIKYLEAEMVLKEVTRKDIVQAIGKSPAYVSGRWVGKYPWTLSDVYTICGLLGVPPEDIHRIFPPRRSR